MAQRRMVERDLAHDEAFNDCRPEARLLYLQARPFTDRDGRLPATARKLRSVVIPDGGFSADEVCAFRDELRAAGLWTLRADVAGEQFVQDLRFEGSQPGLRYDREASAFGEWDGKLDPMNPTNGHAPLPLERAARENAGTVAGSAPGGGREQSRAPKRQRPAPREESRSPREGRSGGDPGAVPEEDGSRPPQSKVGRREEDFQEKAGPTVTVTEGGHGPSLGDREEPDPVVPRGTPAKGETGMGIQGAMKAVLQRIRGGGSGPTEPAPPDTEKARSEAIARLCPVEPGEKATALVCERLAAVARLENDASRVRKYAMLWVGERMKLNAALQLLERLEDPTERKKVREPIAYLRAAVPQRARELEQEITKAVHQALDAWEKAKVQP